jgi:hypothetical protein
MKSRRTPLEPAPDGSSVCREFAGRPTSLARSGSVLVVRLHSCIQMIQLLYSGAAGALLGALVGALIGARLSYGFQKKLLQQQLDFQKQLLDQQLSAEEQSHKTHLEHMTKMASSSVQDHTTNRQVVFDAAKSIVAAIENLKQ